MTQAICTSFKKELFTAAHNFAVGGDAFKFALYSAAATLDETTTVYSPVGETVGTNYVAGGVSLVNADPSASGSTAMVTFATNPLWVAGTFAASQGLIYNVTSGNKAVMVLDFGGTQTVTAGDFLITLPAVTASTALLRLT